MKAISTGLRVAAVFLAVFLVAVIGLVQTGQPAVIGYWRLDGDYTTTVNSVLNGTPTNSPVFTTDVPGPTILDSLGGLPLGTNTNSVQFSGSNYVSIPFNVLLEPASFTIEFFMKAPAQGQWPGIVTKSNFVGGSGPTSWGFGKGPDENAFIRVDTDTSNGPAVSGGGSTGDNRWHHFALTYNGATGLFNIYRDYTLVVGPWDPPGNLHYDGVTGLRLGLMAAGGSFQGYIGQLDEVRFSDTVLTPSQFLAVPSLALQWGPGGTGGTGTWDATTTANWYPGSGAANVTWNVPITTTPNEAIFGGAAGAVTIASSGVTAKSVTFNTPGYTVGGGKLTLATPSVVANQDATITAPIAAPAGLTKSGGAKLTLSGPNVNYSSATTVSAGTLQLSETTNFASPITLSGGNLELGGSSNWVFDSPISGSGTVTKTGANRVTLFGANTYSGQTIVSQGTLQLGAGGVPTGGLAVWLDAGVGVTTNSSGTVTSWDDRSGNGHNATLASGTPVLAANQIGVDPAVQFRKAGGDDWLNLAGTFFAKDIYMVWRSPTAAFDYYGGILGAASGRNSTFITENNNTTMHSNLYPLAVERNGTALASPFNMAPVDQFMLLKVVVNDNNTSAKAYQVGRIDGYSFSIDVAEILAYDHTLSTAEANQLGAYLGAKYGISTSYAGQGFGSIPDNSTVAIASGATFDLNGVSETIGALSDYPAPGNAGMVTNTAAGRNAVLTLAASSGSTSFSGTLQNGAGTVGLVKSGAATQTLRGANINYTGATTVSGGTLALSDTSNFASPVTLSGGTLEVGGNSDWTFNQLVSGNGALVKTGPDTVTLTGAATHTGPTTISQGTLRLGATAPLIHYDFDSLAVTNLGTGGAALNGEVRGATVVAGPVGNALSFSGAAGNSGVTTLNNASIGNAYTFAAWMAVSPGGTNGVSRIIENRFSASGYLGANETGTGYLTIVQGNYKYGPPFAAPATAWHHVAEVWDGTNLYLYVDGSLVPGYPYTPPAGTNSSFTGRFGFACEPGFGQNFRGSLDEPYVFTVALSPAEIQALAQGGVLPAATPVTIAAGAALDLNGLNQAVGSLSGPAGASVLLGGGRLTVGNDNTSTTFGGTISGAGSLVKTGTGTLTLAGANSFPGATTVSQGTLQLGDGAAFNGSVAGNIANDASLVFANPSSQTYAGAISGGGTLLKQAAGTLTLTGNNSYSGGTTVSAGALLVNNTAGSGTGSGDVTVLAGAMLGGTGTIGGKVTVNPGGMISAGNSPGALAIAGGLTENGTMIVDIWGPVQGAPLGYDFIHVTGTGAGQGAILNGPVNVLLGNGFAPPSGSYYDVLTAEAGIVLGPDFEIALPPDSTPLAAAQFWTYRILGSPGGPQTLELLVGVPEPSTLVLTALGFAALGLLGWRRRSRPRR